MIKVENISKRYGDHYAVKDLSFEIEKGKVYGFLGPNGAGKTTTMNIMTGYIAASCGTVNVNGHDILKDGEEAKKCIGYLPELPPLYQDMTVFEYLKFVAELKCVPKAERTKSIEDVMDRTFVTDMKNRLIKNLSKGYKQRVGLAQAMLGNPDIIILDEPTVGLDPKQIIEIRDLIRSLKEDHTVILSSHILSEVAEVCDKLMIIAKGHLIAEGTAEELLGSLGDNNTIEVLIHGDVEDVVEAVKNIDGVIKYDTAFAGEDLVKCILSFEKDKEIRDELCSKLAAKGLAVYGMVTNSKNLEEIFLELTDEVYVNKFIAEKEAEEKAEKEAEKAAKEAEKAAKEAEKAAKKAEAEVEVTAEAEAEVEVTAETAAEAELKENDEKEEE